MSKPRALLIDGNSFCYRAFYAIRQLSTSKGQPTNAIYGFVTMLQKLINELKPDYLAVAFDVQGPTFRHKQFADYKVQRKPMPDQLSVQLPIIKEVLQAYRIAVFAQQGYEADDLIATLVNRLSTQDLEILIVTGDKDFLQIVSDTIKVINPHKDNLTLDRSWVKRRYGLGPEKITEIMALAGDASDSIPGVPGIGEATAIELIKKFGTLEGVLENLDKIGRRAQAGKIKQFVRQAQLSKQLATLESNVPQLVKAKPANLLDQLKIKDADKQKLYTIFKELEFKSLMQSVAEQFQPSIDYNIISEASRIKKFLQKISEKENLVLYLQTSEQKFSFTKNSGIALTWAKGPVTFLPLENGTAEMLKPVLENSKIKKVGHDLKRSKLLLANWNINLQGISFDTMLAAYLLQPERLKYQLSDLALEYLNCKLENFALDRTNGRQAKLGCQVVKIIFELSQILHKQLKRKELFSLFQDIEIPLIGVLADMEQQGVSLNRDLLLRLGHDFDKKLKKLTGDIYELAGEGFNINSPKQLSFILFEKLKLPKLKRTKTGASTDTEVLNRLKTRHPIASALLEFREISKLKSTYIDGLLKLLDPRTGKIHTSFNQTATATGRLSSSQPNLQNIPIKTPLGRGIRQIFIPEKKGNLLLSADYSQIELRILAHLSQDKALIAAFQQDLDIHAYTASLIFQVDSRKVTGEMRSTAKTVNFGIVYGMSAYGLSRDLAIGVDQAQEFIDAYFQRYPGVEKYIKHQINQAKKHGFVTTLMKRRRYIPQINSENENLRQFAQRVAINAPVQGSASDLIKAAMVQIDRSLKTQNLSSKMIIQVHDELVFSLPPEELSKLPRLVKQQMENVLQLRVPIKVSIKTGSNWLNMK